jgi:hypothetical protein
MLASRVAIQILDPTQLKCLQIVFTTCAKPLPSGAVPPVFRPQCRREAPPLERAAWYRIEVRIAGRRVRGIALDQNRPIALARVVAALAWCLILT